MNPAGLAAGIAELDEVDESGEWQRHVSLRRAREALDGHAGQGRWGTAAGFPVLYLGRPTASVVIEAYRHLPGEAFSPELRATLARAQPAHDVAWGSC